VGALSSGEPSGPEGRPSVAIGGRGIETDTDESRACAQVVAPKPCRRGRVGGSASGNSITVRAAIKEGRQSTAYHFPTKRPWSWRDEFGREAERNLLVGRTWCARGRIGFGGRLRRLSGKPVGASALDAEPAGFLVEGGGPA
jgi:hypothetical protein